MCAAVVRLAPARRARRIREDIVLYVYMYMVGPARRKINTPVLRNEWNKVVCKKHTQRPGGV